MEEQNNDMILDEGFPGFDDDLGTEDTLDGTQTEAEAEEAETAETGETENATTPDTEEAPPEGEAENGVPQEDPDAGLPEKITIKYMKGDMDIPKAEIRERLRKGVDYDRVRTQRDAAAQQLEEQTRWRQEHEGVLSTLERMAERSGKDLETVVRTLRVNLYRGSGATEQEAMAKVAQEDAEAKLAAFQRQSQTAQQAQAQQQSRAQKDFLEFNRRYPDVKIQDVPQNVIQKAATGEMSLSNAYAEHLYNELKSENQRLQQSLAAKQQNESNKQKTTGSAKTEGSQTNGDPFLAGFDDF